MGENEACSIDKNGEIRGLGKSESKDRQVQNILHVFAEDLGPERRGLGDRIVLTVPEAPRVLLAIPDPEDNGETKMGNGPDLFGPVKDSLGARCTENPRARHAGPLQDGKN